MPKYESIAAEINQPQTILELGSLSVESYVANNPSSKDDGTQFGTRTVGDDTDINHD